MKYIKTSNITETNRLLKAVGLYVAERLGIGNEKRGKRNGEPWWKRRIERVIKRLRKDIGVLERKKRGELRREEKYQMLERRYKIKSKGATIVLEELKQRVIAKKATVNRYEQEERSRGKRTKMDR